VVEGDDARPPGGGSRDDIRLNNGLLHWLHGVRGRDAPAAPPAADGFDVFLSEQAKDINHARLRHLASLELDLRGKRVLEVGAGIGLHTEFFERLGCTVVSTDGRPGNVRELRRRYPWRDARVFDLDAPRIPQGLGQFDIVYCYGTLYHLQRPEEAIRRLGSLCSGLLLLETLVIQGPGSSVAFVREDASTVNQGIAGGGCRPSRGWVLDRLRESFGYAYATKTQPLHADFDLEWTRPLAAKNHRAVFVASKAPLENPRLSDTLPERQAYDMDHAAEVWIDVGAHAGARTFEQTREVPWRTVYAFEPNIRLASRLFARVPNYVVVPMAVSTQDGFAEFYLNASDATSSLQPIRAPGLEAWIGGESLRIEAGVCVPTIRLDTFLRLLDIGKVHYLKVDAQGADYDVVASLGKRLPDVERVELEVAVTPEQLYEAAHTKDDMIALLTRAGFRLVAAERQSHDQEENLTFVHDDSGQP
jgi:FkbM family methyltransferase